ncbi:MarC family protein [Rubrivirga sp. IMCC45206]|uniref:MarC family protein n=1 Tax=Rubrivirga sp. IMCC45206 TaxID=3391614 RepID=UPI00398FBB76
MPDFVAALVAAFLPLFVAINIPGILPLYIGMTETFSRDDRRQLLVRALLAAAVLAVLMLFAGQIIFDTLGITLNDLRVGGGIILLVIAVTDLAFGDTKDRRGGSKKERAKLHDHAPDEPVDLPVVPLGIPLIIGPGAITTILISDGQFGWVVTLVSILLNMTLVFITFTFGPAILKLAGRGTSKAIAKVASLFLAAISVAMIRAGVLGMIAAA